MRYTKYKKLIKVTLFGKDDILESKQIQCIKLMVNLQIVKDADIY